MKVLYLTIVTFLLIGVFVRGRVIENEEDKEGKLIERFLTRRCTKNGSPEDLEIILEKFRNLKQCIIKLVPKHTIEDEEKLEERCMENREAAVVCFDEFLDAVKPCVDRDENYVIQFLKDSFGAYTRYFCEHSEILTITELLETNTAKCLNRFMKNKEINPIFVCYRTIKMSKDEEDGAITKEELCKDLDEIYDCYERMFKEHCEDAPKAWEFEGGLLKAMKSPCEN